MGFGKKLQINMAPLQQMQVAGFDNGVHFPNIPLLHENFTRIDQGVAFVTDPIKI